MWFACDCNTGLNILILLRGTGNFFVFDPSDMTWTDLSSAVSGAIPVSAHLTATMGRLYVSDGEDPDSRAHRSKFVYHCREG